MRLKGFSSVSRSYSSITYVCCRRSFSATRCHSVRHTSSPTLPGTGWKQNGIGCFPKEQTSNSGSRKHRIFQWRIVCCNRRRAPPWKKPCASCQIGNVSWWQTNAEEVSHEARWIRSRFWERDWWRLGVCFFCRCAGGGNGNTEKFVAVSAQESDTCVQFSSARKFGNVLDVQPTVILRASAMKR